MNEVRYDVVEYGIDRLKEVLAENSSEIVVAEKLHTIYFEEYFKELDAQTIVIENNYIDRDYLEDYAGYYVKCFAEYERWCRRLHFFSTAFNRDQFTALMEDDTTGELDPDTLRKSYLGFIVVKPLPRTIIGRTCLRTYLPNGSRNYPIKHKVAVHLFGHELNLESLPFQEQDREVAACATSALWSAFHGTGDLFHHSVPTPVEITKRATAGEPSESRYLPAADGLDAKKMARAIRSVGLEPFHINARDENILKTTTYAYVRCGIPVLLGFLLVDNSSKAPLPPVGAHAVAVTGYNLGEEPPVPHANTGTLFRATQIDKLYVHDDQVGPFARMQFDHKPAELLDPDGNPVKVWSLHTSWRNLDEDLGCRAIPTMMLLPLYHKIRLPYGYAESFVRTLDSLVNVTGQGVAGFERPVWDVYLTTGADVKESVATQGLVSGAYRRDFLTRPIPRFLWRATALRNGQLLLDILLDATGIEQGDPISAILEYDAELSAIIRGLASNQAALDDIRNSPVAHLMTVLQNLAIPQHLVA